jgi:hypothetical protein
MTSRGSTASFRIPYPDQCREYSYYFEAKVTKAGHGNPALTILRLKGY